MIRKIIHIDLDAFFCAVEEIENPNLAGKPFIVGGDPSQRGVVSSCSYAARKYGIRSAMPSATAFKLYPQLAIIKPNHRLYSQTSKKVMAELKEYSPSFEQISIDEAFIDVSDIQDSAISVGRKIQNKINETLKLPCSIGISTSKLVSKIATDIAKISSSNKNTYPNAILCIEPGKEREFLAPLPVDALPGIGKKTASRLQIDGFHTIGDLAKVPDYELIRMIGKFGSTLSKWSQGIDNRSVVSSHEIKSISRETTFTSDVRDFDLIKQTLLRLTTSVCKQLRKHDYLITTIHIKVRWYDFATVTKQITFDDATDDEQLIFEKALDLLKKILDNRKPVRLIGIGVSGFKEPIIQLGLWNNNQLKVKRINQSIDKLQDKFGKDIIYRGRSK